LPGIPDLVFGSRIVPFSYSGHNKFAPAADPNEITEEPAVEQSASKSCWRLSIARAR
jgi:hypothetical protein